MRLGDKDIKSQKSLKYLVVTFDKDLRMMEHVRQVVLKVADIAARLCQLMPNIVGPRSSKRRVIGGVVGSTILYGAPIRCGALRYAKY